MKRIIGIDLGTYCTGYGILDVLNNKIKYFKSGCINSNFINLNDRLHDMHVNIFKICINYKPNFLIIEKFFYFRSYDVLIKLSKLSGIVISIALLNNINFFEYNIKKVRKNIILNGNVNKKSISKFICKKFNIKKIYNFNITDALALAFAHYNYLYKI